MVYPETSFEEERGEVRDSIRQYLSGRTEPEGEVACAFLLRHLAGYDERKEKGEWIPVLPLHRLDYRPSGRLP